MNLGQFEDRINNDPRLRQEFLRDPVGVLRREGLILSFDQERALRQAVAKPELGDPNIKYKIGFVWCV